MVRFPVLNDLIERHDLSASDERVLCRLIGLVKWENDRWTCTQSGLAEYMRISRDVLRGSLDKLSALGLVRYDFGPNRDGWVELTCYLEVVELGKYREDKRRLLATSRLADEVTDRPLSDELSPVDSNLSPLDLPERTALSALKKESPSDGSRDNLGIQQFSVEETLERFVKDRADKIDHDDEVRSLVTWINEHPADGKRM